MYGELEEIEVPVWAISGDDPARLRAYREGEGIEFDFLLDPEGATFTAYGILNARHDKTVPHPTVLVVDADRVVHYVASDVDYKVRPSSAEVVEAVRGLIADAGE